MRSFLYLAALACVQGQSPTSSVSAPAVAVVGTQGPAGVQQTLLKNLPTFSVLPNAPNSFDVCATCLANPLDPSSLVPTCVPQQSRVSLECVSGGLNSVHVVLDSQLLIQLTFNQLSQASVLILVKATEVSR
ncbi:hypothetical protein BC830DRAFT_368661 [Chytriomyces sp. MP71]|nr:hypothetical protein BC830DRAFT_368661 [Chytriomyces sp. MP71]